MDTFTALTRELQLKGATLERLRRLFLGSTSEKTKKVLGDDEKGKGEEEKASGESAVPSKEAAKEKARGHGRNGAAAYTGARREKVTHASLHGGDGCPGCTRGKVYPMKEPALLLRVKGMAPLDATCGSATGCAATGVAKSSPRAHPKASAPRSSGVRMCQEAE